MAKRDTKVATFASNWGSRARRSIVSSVPRASYAPMAPSCSSARASPSASEQLIAMGVIYDQGRFIMAACY